MARIAFLLAATVLILTGAYSAISTARFLQHASVAQGVVVALDPGGSHPEIRFTASDGTSLSYPQGGFIFSYRVGDTVRVYYDAQDPNGTARIGSFGSLWGLAIFLLVLGALFVWGGVSID